MEQEHEQNNDIIKFNNDHTTQITSDKLEQFMFDAAELGGKLELNEIKTKLIEKILMNQIDFSDPQNMKNLLPILPEFIFYCSSRNSMSGTLGSLKTIPISNFKFLLLKIIDNREGDSIDDILKEIVSLIFVLDEQNEGSSATENAMKFACELVNDHTYSQYEVVLGIRLMAALINSRFVPEEIILNALNPARFQEPYVRKNQYIAIKEILSRAGPYRSEGSNYRHIPYDHPFFYKILSFIDKVELKSSYEKSKIYHDCQEQGLNTTKWNNIIIIKKNKDIIDKVYELDQWVQCQFIELIPYIYEIEQEVGKTNIWTKYLNINNLENIKNLSWNVQFNYLLMLRSSKKILYRKSCSEILAYFYMRAEMNSDFQTACILAIIDFLKSQEDDEIENIQEEEEEEENIQEEVKGNVNNEKAPSDTDSSGITSIIFFDFLNEQAKNELNDIAKLIKENALGTKAKLNFIFRIIPILTSLMIYFSKNYKQYQDQINEIINRMNQIPVKIHPNCCKIFLESFYIKVPEIEKYKNGDSISEKVEEALHFLMISEDDFDDRLFFIKIINNFFDAGSTPKQKALSLMIPIIDMISNDPVYIVRDSAVQTVLRFLAESTLSDVLDYIQQIFPGSSFNGKKSLLSLIASIIVSIDPFEDKNEKEKLFSFYIDQIFLIIKDSQNRDLKKFFRDILRSIWTLLPEKTKEYFIDIYA